MKKYGKLFGMMLALILLIGVAVFAYGKLKNQAEHSALVEEGGGETETGERASSQKQTESETADENTAGAGTSGGEQNEERQEAVDVTFYDGAGNAVRLSDFYGKPVVLNFWATWCVYCKQEMPDFQEAYEEYGEEAEFLFLNSTDGERETREKAAAYLEEQGYTVPAYYDEDMEAVYAYSIYSLPTTILIDKEGRVAAYAPGLMEKETLTKALEALLAEK